MRVRVGQGFDVHPFVDDAERPLVLGGVTFESPRALRGHSDADVIAHACADALLGAAGLGDIGEHFPDTDPTWAGADSIGLLAEATRRGLGAGQRRRLGGHRPPEAGARPSADAGAAVGRRGRAGHREGPPTRGPRSPRPGRGRGLLGRGRRDPTVSFLRRRAVRRADQTSTVGEPRRQPRSNDIDATTGDHFVRVLRRV